jgi:hypothetical protein
MSKESPKNILTFSERIVKVLIDNNIVKKNGEPNFSAAERKCGMKGTVIQKAVKRQGGLYDDNLDKFLRTFHVKREWLLYGKGEQYEKNGTRDTNNEQPDDIWNHPVVVNLSRELHTTREYAAELKRQLDALRGGK